MKQRNALYNLSMKYKFYLIVDDIYESMYFNEDARLPPLYYCNDENTKKFNEGAKFINHDLNYNPYTPETNNQWSFQNYSLHQQYLVQAY